MNKAILKSGVQNFISKNIDTDIVSFLFKKSIFDAVSPKELAEQIESKKKCKKKLPTWFETAQVYYPNKLNIEQTSSELSAHYKSEIVSGKSLVDLTGGFGVDSYFFSQKMNAVFHCEIDAKLTEIASHNFKVLGIKNITTVPHDGLQFLKNSNDKFDWLFIDPSRRNDKNGKVFRLSDCTPNVVEHLDLLFDKSDNILIKTAPLLDISIGMAELRNIKKIHIVAVNGEVKELLWHLEKDFFGKTLVKTANLTKTKGQKFDFLYEEERDASSAFQTPLTYLYEPNAAILKSGAFKTLGSKLSLKKIHRHTHLYTSDKLIGFPGRKFKVNEVLPYDKRTAKVLKKIKANVATRNFPKTVAEIRKSHQIRDGGPTFLFFVTNYHEDLIVLKCEKMH